MISMMFSLESAVLILDLALFCHYQGSMLPVGLGPMSCPDWWLIDAVWPPSAGIMHELEHVLPSVLSISGNGY